MSDIALAYEDDPDRASHSLFFSNKLSMMPDSQELGAMIASYGRLLKAYQKVQIQIDPEFDGSYVVPELIRYEATGSGFQEWIIKLCWGDEKKKLKWEKDILAKNRHLRWANKHRKRIGLVTLGLITVAPLAVKFVPSSDGEADKTPHLSGIQNQTINIGATEYSIGVTLHPSATSPTASGGIFPD